LNVVFQDVINNVRDDFLDEGAEERALMELKSVWEAKLKASKTIEPPAPPQAPLPQAPVPQSAPQVIINPKVCSSLFKYSHIFKSFLA
jgi:hypothetical protein